MKKRFLAFDGGGPFRKTFREKKIDHAWFSLQGNNLRGKIFFDSCRSFHDEEDLLRKFMSLIIPCNLWPKVLKCLFVYNGRFY